MLLSEIARITGGRLIAFDKDFVESDHPRGKGEKGGEFVKKGSGGGGSSSSSKMTPVKVDKKGTRTSADGKALPPHIAAAKIPPAWTDVTYSSDPKAELLVKGKDSKGRVQYVYSEAHWTKMAEKKFARIDELGKKFDSIQKENEAKLKKTKSEECLVLKLIMQTGIRPGSDEDTQAKVKAYGATTLQGRHVKVSKDGVVLNFIGKKGIENNIPVTDRELAKELAERSKKAGADGNLFNTSGDSLLKYSSGLDGGGFKTKDFRTLLGTRSAMEEVKKGDPPSNEKEYKKRVKEVAKVVAGRLGNTWVVALQSYIAPAVFAEWKGAF